MALLCWLKLALDSFNSHVTTDFVIASN